MFRGGEYNPNSGAEVAHRSVTVVRDEATIAFFGLNWVFCVKDAISSCMTNIYLSFCLIMAKGLRVDITQP